MTRSSSWRGAEEGGNRRLLEAAVVQTHSCPALPNRKETCVGREYCSERALCGPGTYSHAPALRNNVVRRDE